MSKQRCQELTKIGDQEFSKRSSLLSTWQDIAEHFDPARADFTSSHSFGDDFAAHLMTGFPAMQLRELADQLATMLRPRQKLWAKLVASNERINKDTAARQWLDAKSEVMRKAMYARPAHFLRATKRGDKDFALIGQAVIRPRLNSKLDGLMYICDHPRDVVWCEDADLKISTVHRKEKRTATTLVQSFPKTVSEIVRRAAKDEPYREFACRHIVVPSDDYALGDGKQYNKQRFPFVSIYLDTENDTILEEVPQSRLGYVIPRWELGALGQYAVSPATMLALPDSRLLQQMTVSLLEAQEKAVNPPVIARGEVVRSDIQMFANGFTWLDYDGDKSVGDYLQTVNPEIAGLQHGMQMLLAVEAKIKDIFYLNKLHLPEIGKDMTAFEVRERVSEFVRAALPLFEPMEVEYNGALCEDTFALLMENGGFGPPDEMPEVLRGQDVRFEFESPLQATADRAKVMAFQEVAELLGVGMQIDPTLKNEINVKKAFRDAVDGTQAPADWKNDPKQVEELNRQTEQMLAAQAAMAQVGQGAGVAEVAGKAAKQFSDAGML